MENSYKHKISKNSEVKLGIYAILDKGKWGYEFEISKEVENLKIVEEEGNKSGKFCWATQKQ